MGPLRPLESRRSSITEARSFRHIDVAKAEKATRAKAKRVLVPAA
ncbi:hypothetical protein [Streptomyces platensis]